MTPAPASLLASLVGEVTKRQSEKFGPGGVPVFPIPSWAAAISTFPGPMPTFSYAYPVEYTGAYQEDRYTEGQITGIFISSAALLVTVPSIGWICYRRYCNRNMYGGQAQPTTPSGPNVFGKLFAKLTPRKISDEEKAAEEQASTVSTASSVHNGSHQRGDTYLPNSTTHQGSSRAPSSR
ncbi:hypothetical protein MMC14_000545 [Varicellaria rhodocarpa]|nr:hypothetical protein [Varicellaria rhodocarpa]